MRFPSPYGVKYIESEKEYTQYTQSIVAFPSPYGVKYIEREANSDGLEILKKVSIPLRG